MRFSVPLAVLLKEMLDMAHSARAMRFLLNEQEVLVNGVRVRRLDASAGLFDVVAFPTLKANYRIVFNTLGKLHAIPISGEDAKTVPSKITSKQMLAGKKLQLGFHNGKTLLVAKSDEKVGSTILLGIDGKVHSSFPLEVGVFVVVISGKHVGCNGVITECKDGVITLKTGDDSLLTRSSHVFALGKEKSAIKITET